MYPAKVDQDDYFWFWQTKYSFIGYDPNFIFTFIFSALITFTESEDEPVWKGYMYAVLMIVCAQIQSLVLGQYFMKMFLAGLRIRTGVISAVYRKVKDECKSMKK